jgi:hypothetical protein
VKIISHIKWLVTNSNLCKRHSFYNQEIDHLNQLSLNNLLMMEHQLSKSSQNRQKQQTQKNQKIKRAKTGK